MQRLAFVVLVISDPRDFRYGAEGVWKVFEQAGVKRDALAGLGVCREAHAAINSPRNSTCPSFQSHVFTSSGISKCPSANESTAKPDLHPVGFSSV